MAKIKEVLEESEKKNGFLSGLKGLLVFLFLFVFFFVLDWSFLSGAIVEYPIMCPDGYHEGNGCYALNTTTYYPGKKTQTVKMKSEGYIDTLKRCTVIDRRNWQCAFNDGSATFGFNNGQFHSTTLFIKADPVLIDKFDKETHYVPRYIFLMEEWQLI